MHSIEHSTGSERVDAFGLREMVLGKSRQAHQRTAGSPANANKAYLPLPIVHSSITRPCCSSAQAPSFLTGSERVDAFGQPEMVLGKSRQAHQRTAGSPPNAKLTFRYPSSLINHSTLLLERSSAKLLVFYASTRSRRAVEVIICMITRDFSVISIDVTGVSLSLYYSQKSLTHKIGNASAFPIMKQNQYDQSVWPLALRTAVIGTKLEPIVSMGGTYEEIKKEILVAHGQTAEKLWHQLITTSQGSESFRQWSVRVADKLAQFFRLAVN